MFHFIFRCAPTSDCKSTEIGQNNLASCTENGHYCCAIEDIAAPIQTTIPTLSGKFDKNFKKVSERNVRPI